MPGSECRQGAQQTTGEASGEEKVGDREGESVGEERGGVSDRLSGCTGISSTQRHMILRSEVIPADEYRGSVSSALTKEKRELFLLGEAGKFVSGIRPANSRL